MRFSQGTYLLLLLFLSSFAQSSSFKTLNHSYRTNSLQFTPDGKALLIGTNNGSATLWNSETLEHKHTFAHNPNQFDSTTSVNAMAFSPNGWYLLTSALDEPAKLWNVKTKQLLHTFEEEKGKNQVSQVMFFSPDSQKVFINETVYDRHTLNPLYQFKEQKVGTQYASFTFDSNAFRTIHLPGGISQRSFKKVLWWNPTKKKESTRIFKSHSVSPDGSRIFVLTDKNSGRLLDAKTFKTISTLTWPKNNALRSFFSPDGTKLVTLHQTGNTHGEARIWDLKTGLQILKTPTDSLIAPFNAFITQDNETLITQSGATLDFWNLTPNLVTKKTGEAQIKVKMRGKFSKLMALSPDGSSLAVGMRDPYSVRIYSIPNILKRLR